MAFRHLTVIAYGLEPRIMIKIYIPGMNQLSVAKQIAEDFNKFWMKIISLPDANSSPPQSVIVVPIHAKTEQLVMKSKMDMNACAHLDTRELIVMVCIFPERRVYG